MNTYLTMPSITPEIIERAKALQRYAFDHRETTLQVNNRLSTRTPGPRQKEEHHLEVPIGYRVVYAIYQDVTGWNQHVEISVSKPKMEASPNAVNALLKLFGIEGERGKPVYLSAAKIWSEPIDRITIGTNFLFPFDLTKFQQTMEAA